MSNAMQQGRIDKVLDTVMNFGEGFGIMSRREYLKACFRDGSYYTDISQVHPFTWSSRKFNNMDSDKQREYEKRYNKFKTAYNLKKNDSDTFFEITKIEFDYFNSLTTEG